MPSTRTPDASLFALHSGIVSTRRPYFVSFALLVALGCADKTSDEVRDAQDAGPSDAQVDASSTSSSGYAINESDAGAPVGYVAALTPLWGLQGDATGHCNGCHYVPLQSFDGKPDMQGWQALVGRKPGTDGLPPMTVGDPAAPCAERTFVVPGKPEESYLIDKLIGHAQIKGNCFAGQRMPPDCEVSNSCLGEVDVQRVADWIRAGAKFP